MSKEPAVNERILACSEHAADTATQHAATEYTRMKLREPSVRESIMSKDDKFRIKRDAVLGEAPVGHLVVEAFVSALDSKDLEEFLVDCGWNDLTNDDFECYIVFEGKKLPIATVMEHWGGQMEELIENKALALIEKKLIDIENCVDDIVNALRQKAADKLGILL